MVKKVIGTLVLLLIAAFAAVAQNLPNVDIETATTQVQQFKLEVQQLQQQIAALKQSNETLSTNIDKWNGWIEAIGTVQSKLDDTANALYDAISELSVKAVMDRAQATLDQYTKLKKLLSDKVSELKSEVSDAKTSITGNLATINTLNEKVKGNLQNIDLLNSAIQKSKSSEATLQTYVDALDKVLKEAADVLNSTQQ